jgi:hypothetical protein
VLQVRLVPPLLVTTVSGTLVDADIDTLRSSNEQALRNGGRLISLVDVSQIASVPTPLQRRTYAAWRRDHYDELKRHIVAVAFVVGDRPILRGGLTALSWLARHPSPEAYFAERADALQWLHERLEAVETPQRPKARRSM